MSDIIVKNTNQIEGIKKSCVLASKTLEFISEFVTEGVSTEFLDNKIDEFIRDHNAIPAPLNYNGFPKSCCTSVNDVVCHGIPSSKQVLKEGDILNIDITTILDGFFGDTSSMFSIGEITKDAQELLVFTKECLNIGIKQSYPGNMFGNIGYEIARFAKENGYGVVYEYCGHGVGLKFHEPPEIQHIADKNSGEMIKPGYIFTIEPMINQGKARTKLDKSDGWTARTIDGKLSAQYEHTILITETGNEVLTDIKGEQ